MAGTAYDKARAALESVKRAPEMVVFDLDYTLWPFWCEMLRPSDTPHLYPDALAIIDAIRSKNIKVAAASRTPTPRTANAFLEKLDLKKRFDSIQLIPASSGFDHSTAQKDQAHFPKIHQETAVDYRKMLFFDDEHGNIQRVSRLGVTSVLVNTSKGVDVEAFKHGLELFDRASS